MGEELPSGPVPSELQAKLRTAAQELRHARHIDPEAQRALADLVLELAEAIDPNAPCDRTAHLAESSSQVLEALHHAPETGLLATARERLEEAAASAESKAPVAAGIARQLVDLLAGIGV